jgi:glutamyl-tRNAGlu reductase-like protein
MSPITRVLHDRFEEICRAELIRLRRKTACLSATDRGELDDISLSVVRAIATRLGEALDRDTAPETGSIVTHLFVVTPRE